MIMHQVCILCTAFYRYYHVRIFYILNLPLSIVLFTNLNEVTKHKDVTAEKAICVYVVTFTRTSVAELQS